MSRALTWVNGKFAPIVAVLAAIVLMAVTVGFAPAALAEEVEETAAVEAADIADAETDDSATVVEETVIEPEPEPAPAPAPQPEPAPEPQPEPTEPRAPPVEDATVTETQTDNSASVADEPVNNSASAEEEAADPVQSEPAPAPQAATPEREAITAVPPPVVVAPTCEADGYVLDPVDTRYWFDVIPVPDGTGFVAKALTDISKYYFELENGINDTEHLITGDLKKLSGAECEVDTGNGDDGDGEDTGNGTDPQPGDGDETDERAVDEDGFPIEPLPGAEKIYLETAANLIVTPTSVGGGTVTVSFGVPDIKPYGDGRFAVSLYKSLFDNSFYEAESDELGGYTSIKRGETIQVEVLGVPDGEYTVSVYFYWDRAYEGEILPYDTTVYDTVNVVTATPDTGNGDGDGEGDGTTDPVDGGDTPSNPDEGEGDDTGSNPGDQPGEDEGDDVDLEAVKAEWEAEYPGSTGTIVPVNATSFVVPETTGRRVEAVILYKFDLGLGGGGLGSMTVPVITTDEYEVYEDVKAGKKLKLKGGGIIYAAIVLTKPVSTGGDDEQPAPNPTPDTGNGDEGENGEEPGTQPDDDPYDDTDSGDNPSGGGQDDDELKGFTESVKVKGCIVKGFISNPNDVPVVYSIVIGESGEEIELTVPANGREKFIITDLPAGEHSITIADRSSSVTTSVVVEECVVDEPEVVTEPTGSITVDCHGVGEAIADNTASTTGNLGNLGFELRYQTADGAQTKTVTVPGGKESEPITFSGALPGTKVSLWALDAKVASAIVPAACEEPTEPPVTPEPPVDEPTDEEPSAPKPPSAPSRSDRPATVVVVEPTPIEVVLPFGHLPVPDRVQTDGGRMAPVEPARIPWQAGGAVIVLIAAFILRRRVAAQG